MDARRVCSVTPFDNGTEIPPTFTTELVGPCRSGVCERVRMRVVPTVDHLPLQVPTALRSLAKPEIDVSALLGQPEPRLSRGVPNNRDAISDNSSAKSAAMSVPVFPR